MTFVRQSAIYLSMTALIAATTLFAPHQASATTSLECTGLGGNNEIGLTVLFGAGPILVAIEADGYVGERAVSTRGFEGAEEAVIAQFSGDEKQISLELMDTQADKHLASIRILRHFAGDAEPLQIGYMQLANDSAVGITCDGP